MQSVVDFVTILQIKKIHVTGHSIGGALTTYGAADIAVLLKAKYSFTNSKDQRAQDDKLWRTLLGQ